MTDSWWEDSADLTEKKAEWDYVLRAFAGAQLRKGWNRAACLRCHDIDGKDDKKLSLNYNIEGAYNCYRCGMHGQLPPAYRRRLGDDDPFTFLEPPEPEPPKVVEPCDGFTLIFEEPAWSADVFGWARAYLLGKRGLKPQACYEAGVGAVLTGRLGGRIVVPIPDYDDPRRPWRGWVAREALGRPTPLTYRYAKGMQRVPDPARGFGPLLYNAPALLVETSAPCFIVEGTLDVLSLWPDAVGVLGKPLACQLDLFARARRPLVVCLDGDAWEADGLKLTWDLRMHGLRAGNIRLPPKTDPDEVPRDWLDAEAQRVLGLS